MPHNHLKEFRVENFKKFKILELSNIGQFNLIVGDNNVGKTSLLESLLFDEKVETWISDLNGALSYRDIDIDYQEMTPLNLFFHNSLATQAITIAYTSNNSSKPITLKIELLLSSTLGQKDLEKLNLKNLGRNPYKFSARIYKNEQILDTVFVKEEYDNDDNYMPFISNSNVFDEDLIEFYSDHIQRKKTLKSNLIKNLSSIIPQLENIEVSSSKLSQPTFLITLKNQEEAQIINQFGEGSIKLLRILLESFICRGNRILIDEIASGIHYSRLKDFFKLLLSDQKENEVQLFATTHSKECIENFIQATKELKIEQDSRIIRLAETKSGIRAYTMQFEEFENALIAESEIR